MAKMRSPNFPAIHLAQAIDLAERIFREDRTNAIEKEDAAKHMGYSGLTGRTLKLFGALSQFGLLEKVAKGQVRVSRTAVSIMHPSSEEERIEAIGRAGRSPALFKKIRDAFPEDPSDRTISSFLIREGFTDSAIPSVLKSYRETNRFLADAGAAESREIDGEEETDLLLDEDEELATNLRPVGSGSVPQQAASMPSLPPVDGPLDFNLSSAGLSVSGRTNSAAELKAFITTLTTLAGLLPDKSQGQDVSEEDDRGVS
jgi:hypothetical protein